MLVEDGVVMWTMRGGVAAYRWRFGTLFVCWGVLATLAGAVHSARDGKLF